jgi:hypothetical protein
MAVITKTWTSISDTAIDPDSPITTGLMTALRDNAIHLREWLGASFVGGAVQDHDHDGQNSALIEIGPNMLRNGSFESHDVGWTVTPYTGGSFVISTTQRQHGAKSLAITSTVLANGGALAVSNAYMPVGGGDVLQWQGWLWASATNVSSRLEAIWYDASLAQISASALVDLTTTPTSATEYQGTVTAPATARFVRVRCTGGVPAAGTNVGTTYFDGLALAMFAITQSLLLPAAVGQAQLKTTSGSVSRTANGLGTLVLPGGEYGFYPRSQFSSGGGGGYGFEIDIHTRTGQTGAVAAATYVSINNNAGAFDDETTTVLQRYVQASPPYDLGNGEVPLFVFAHVNRGTGRVEGTYIAEDPPWANNGPTNVRAEYVDGSGRAWRRAGSDAAAVLKQAREGRMSLREAAETLREVNQWVQITQDMKQADMPLIPHPFIGHDQATHTVVLLDPVGSRAELLHELHKSDVDLVDEIRRRSIVLDNVPLDAVTPPGVQAVRWSFK